MNKQIALDILCGLEAPQQKRYVMYHKNLSTDKDPGVFDDRMLEYINEVCTDVKWVEDKVKYLNSIGWNQSKYSFEQMRVQAKRFAEANHPYFGWNKHFKKAKERRISEAEQFFLKMIQYGRNENIEDYLPREDTHAGFSYILTGKKEKGKYRERLSQAYEEEVAKARKNGSFNKPIIVGTRTQASDPFEADGTYNYEYRDKTRLVSMIDIYVIMAEIVYAKRLQTKLSGRKWYAGGKDDMHILYFMNKWNGQYKYWLSIDYSKYDQSISNWLIREAFDVVRAAYKHDPNFDEELFKIVREDFINKVIILGPDDIYECEKGVPSGSMFTQIIDSIVNTLMIDTYMLSRGIENYEMMIMGDDNIIFTNIEIDREDLSSYLAHNFGIEMHPDKCTWKGKNGDSPEFLSREWTTRGVHRKPEILLAKLIFPERFRDYKRNPDMSPELIVQCFKDTYPLGMKKLISGDHYRKAINIRNKIGDGRWLSGLMRYRLLYAS